jgi:hypothetical protein
MPPLQNLENSPWFRGLSNEEQIKARLALFRETFKDDLGFQNLSNQGKQKLMEQVTVRSPSFLDRRFEDTYRMILSKAQGGDKSSKKLLSEMITAQKLSTQSLLFNIVGGKILSPLISGFFPEDSGRDLAIGTRFMQLTKEDQAKAADYADFLLNEDKAFVRMNRINQIGSTLFNIGETVGLYAFGAGAPLAPRALGKLFTSPFLKAASKASGATRQILALGREVSHAAATGLLGATKETILQVAQKSSQDPEFQEIAVNSARYFKDYFLGDILFNVAGGILWPMMKGSLKAFKGFGETTPYLKGLTEEELQEVLSSTWAARRVNPTLYAKLPDEVKRVVNAGRNAFKVFRNVSKINEDEMLQMVAMKSGFAVNQVGGRWQISNVGSVNVTWASTREEALDKMAKQILAQRPLGVLEAATSGAASQTAQFKQVVSARLRSGEAQNTDVLTRLIAPRRGRFTENGVRSFLKAFLKGKGASDDVIRSVKVVVRGGDVNYRIGDEVIESFKQNIGSGKQEIETIKKLVNRVSDFANAKNFKAGSGFGEFSETYTQALRDQRIHSVQWAEETARDLKSDLIRRADGNWQTIDNEGITRVFSNIEEVENYLIRETADYDWLRDYLWQEQGLNLSKNSKTGEVVVRQRGKVLYRAKSEKELLGIAPELVQDLPAELGPKITFVDSSNTLNVKYSQGVASGNYPNVMKFLDRFKESTPKRAKINIGKRGAYLSTDSTRKYVQTFIPEINYRKEFTSIKEAREFVETGWKEFDNLETIAHQKGYRLAPSQGKFILYSTENQRFIADDVEEVAKILSEVPIPDWAPELSGIASEILEPMPRPLEGMFEPVSLAVPSIDPTIPIRRFGQATTSFADTISQWVRPPDVWL